MTPFCWQTKFCLLYIWSYEFARSIDPHIILLTDQTINRAVNRAAIMIRTNSSAKTKLSTLISWRSVFQTSGIRLKIVFFKRIRGVQDKFSIINNWPKIRITKPTKRLDSSMTSFLAGTKHFTVGSKTMFKMLSLLN